MKSRRGFLKSLGGVLGVLTFSPKQIVCPDIESSKQKISSESLFKKEESLPSLTMASGYYRRHDYFYSCTGMVACSG